MRPPSQSRTRRTRRGVGAPFVIVLAVLVLLSLFAIAMNVRSQGAAVQSRRALVLERCDEVANMALVEGLALLRKRANDPDDAIYEPLRDHTFMGALALGLDDLEHAPQDAERIEGYALTGLTVEVIRRAGVGLELSERAAYQHVGLIRLTASATGLQGASSTRTADYGLRVNLVTPPRPFDLFTCFIGAPAVLLTEKQVNGNANVTMVTSAEKLKKYREQLTELSQKLLEVIAEAERQINSAAASAGSLFGGGSDLAQARQMVAQLRTLQARVAQTVVPPTWPAVPDWEVMDAGVLTDDDPRKVHQFATPLALYSFEDEVDLAELNLPARIGPLVESTQTRRPQVEAAAQAMQAALNSQDMAGAMSSANQFLDLVVEDANELHQILEGFKRFQKLFVEAGEGAANQLAARFRRFSPFELRARADWVFEGQFAAARAARFLSIGGLPTPSGILYVDDPDEPMTVNLQGFQGNLIIASRGDMVVENAQVQDKGEDTLTLVAGARMRVDRGGLHAALVCTSSSYRGSGDSFEGSLVLGGLEVAALNLALTGRVKRLPALASGPNGFPDRPAPESRARWVTVSPYPRWRGESR